MAGVGHAIAEVTVQAGGHILIGDLQMADTKISEGSTVVDDVYAEVVHGEAKPGDVFDHYRKITGPNIQGIVDIFWSDGGRLFVRRRAYLH
jgi:hypothetical protein